MYLSSVSVMAAHDHSKGRRRLPAEALRGRGGCGALAAYSPPTMKPHPNAGPPPPAIPSPIARQAALIGLDWGTSSLRGWLFDADGGILARRGGGQGVMAVASDGFAAVFEAFCEPWLALAPGLPVIAAGMIGSRQGWREAAYLPAPAGAAELAAALLPLDELAGRVFRVVPGVVADQPDGACDVMRGEETQVIGALAAWPAGDRSPGCTRHFVLPGTHGKWVGVRDDRIVELRTSLTGETWAALRDHTILGRLCEDPDPDDPQAQARAWQAFDQGVAQIRAQPGALLHLLFRVRTEGLFGRLSPGQLPAYLSGLLIGAEVGDALAWRPASSEPPVLVGTEAQVRRHARALAGFGLRSVHAAPERAAAGLFQLARAAGLAGG
jgi:2-dehydro-3-deoxygalactonokinase